MKRAVYTLAAVLCVAAVLHWYTDFGLRPAVYWLAAILIGTAAAFANRRAPAPWSPASGEFLCDTCKYNDARYCSRPERPNAVRCPDYKN